MDGAAGVASLKRAEVRLIDVAVAVEVGRRGVIDLLYVADQLLPLRIGEL